MTTTPECQRWRQAVFEAADAARLIVERPEFAAHQHACAACRGWLETYLRGLADAGQIAGVGAAATGRTAAAACERARNLAGSAFDDPPAAFDRALLDEHLTACPPCREVMAEMVLAAAVLPALADVDPGPAFTSRVLFATSRRPAATRFADTWRRAWSAMIDRPRFALEAAYAATVVIMLITGNPISALERTAARVEPAARDRLAVGVETMTRTIAGALQVLKARVETQAAVPAHAQGLVARARGLLNGVMASLTGGLSDLLDAIVSAAERIWQWGRGLFGNAAPTGEPQNPFVRSPR